jgi:hypothetical protein
MGNNFSNPVRRDNNPDDAIGDDKELSDACILYNSTGVGIIQRTLIPDNGEYEFAKATGDCNYCDTCSPRRAEKGAGCQGTWCGYAGGLIPYYHRKSYLAPKDQCCTSGGAKVINGLTCDPQYRAGVSAPACNDIFAGNCVGQTNENVLDDTCQTWCKANTDRCNAAIANFCSQGNNLDRADCRAHALELGGADLDVAANRWCGSHMDDPFCACLKAVSLAPTIPTEISKALSRPECFVIECTSGQGYQNVNMRAGNKTCPSVAICNNTIALGTGATNVSLDDVNQTCDQTINTDTSTTDNQQKQSTTTATRLQQVYDKVFDTDNAVEYFILFIVVILLLVSGIALFLGDDDEDEKSPLLEDAGDDSLFW